VFTLLQIQVSAQARSTACSADALLAPRPAPHAACILPIRSMSQARGALPGRAALPPAEPVTSAPPGGRKTRMGCSQFRVAGLGSQSPRPPSPVGSCASSSSVRPEPYTPSKSHPRVCALVRHVSQRTAGGGQRATGDGRLAGGYEEGEAARAVDAVGVENESVSSDRNSEQQQPCRPRPPRRSARGAQAVGGVRGGGWAGQRPPGLSSTARRRISSRSPRGLRASP
jgi:hypothetical protein